MTEKFEPLKGKIETTIEPFTKRKYKMFDFDDVKSAVQGLLSDLDEYVWFISTTMYDPHGLIKAKVVKNLIKKWFPDVVVRSECR